MGFESQARCMPILVIAAYHCQVAGKPTASIDYQVRQFDSDSLEEITARLRSEPLESYKNRYGQEVRWTFHDTVAVEFNPEFTDGEEVIGFISGKPKETERSSKATCRGKAVREGKIRRDPSKR